MKLVMVAVIFKVAGTVTFCAVWKFAVPLAEAIGTKARRKASETAASERLLAGGLGNPLRIDSMISSVLSIEHRHYG